MTRRSRNSGLALLLLWVVVVSSSRVTSAAAVLTFPTTADFPTHGPIEDAACNIEDLEKANDSQLYTILHDLTETAFFRHFVVDLRTKCPLAQWTTSTSSSSSSSHSNDDTDNTSDDNDDEFECSGGADELDEDAEPLCTVQPESQPFGLPPSLESNALFSISQDGFQSKAQEDTFSWKQHSDVVVDDDDDDATDCQAKEETALLPDSFWVDLCQNILDDPTSSDVVNLALNPERNTGYNGTHIWRAIYEENCILAPAAGEGMCLEERVLYRLLSGLHSSTTISIALNYYPPSKRKGRPNWEANPTYFMDKFKEHPDYIRNLHFSYVVLLRALRKAAPFLYNYEVMTGDIVEDETATVLLKRLLDSGILNSCSSVFSAFDESLMFQEDKNPLDVVSLQQNFKGVFHNISSILDCVQCQQCKLHGKMAMLGYGTALKILFMRNDSPDLERNEIVALINTIAKFSESIRTVRELTQLYWQQQQDEKEAFDSALSGGTTTKSTNTGSSTKSVETNVADSDVLSYDSVDAAVGVVATLGQQGMIGLEQEQELVKLAIAKDPTLLILARHYRTQPEKFLQLSAVTLGAKVESPEPDAIVVGSGLAGLSATLTILDRGGHVLLLEKEHLLGGNSNKASSGINACCPEETSEDTDSVELFRNDTTRSAGASAHPELIDVLVQNSRKAVEWLRTRVGVDLSLTAQLGGHKAKRTHRPVNGMAGAEIIYGLQKAVRKYEKTGQVTIMVDTQVTGLQTEDGRVVGVEFQAVDNSAAKQTARSPYVILATGGFASDRTNGSYLDQYRPELKKMATTAGHFSTGDGISIAKELNAGLVDMEHVQIHPTAWVDPTDPDNTSKVLAAELMRGVGGILVNKEGNRFCNELGTRAYVSDKMLEHNDDYAKERRWKEEAKVPSFYLILSEESATNAQRHVDLYSHKGLLQRIEGVTALAKWMGVSTKKLSATLVEYEKASKMGQDSFGKTVFKGVMKSSNLEKQVFFAGMVTPAIHYCMGGVTIDTNGRVLTADEQVIEGLYAAGEVSGGVHGVNRLGGNSLLECTVYGTRVGGQIPIQKSRETSSIATGGTLAKNDASQSEDRLRTVSKAELEQHNTADDCWVAIHGTVYDLTSFADEHPAGAESIIKLAGTDGTAAFAAVHNANLLEEDFNDDRIGVLESVDSQPKVESQPSTAGASAPIAATLASAFRS